MPIIISQNGQNAKRIEKSAFDDEGYLQKYIYNNPESIPLYEIKEDIRLLILARELPTNSGSIDAFGIDRDGEIYIIETKLYKNPDKRTVIAQVLDYGAALWKHITDFNKFLSLLRDNVQKTYRLPLEQKLQEYYGLSAEETDDLINSISSNLSDGALHFVILMDKLDDRLKDLILYVNENSEFDIYAVELEYYKYQSNEIIIPRIFGAEVKKDVGGNKKGKLWTWELFEERLREYGDEEVAAAKQILDWSDINNIQISWSSSQIGSFIMGFYTDGKKGFFPFSVSGNAMVNWNAPHQENYSPPPFDKPAKRAEILKRLKLIKDAKVDLTNIDGYNGFKLPLRAIMNEDTCQEFFSVCRWIIDTLKNE